MRPLLFVTAVVLTAGPALAQSPLTAVSAGPNPPLPAAARGNFESNDDAEFAYPLSPDAPIQVLRAPTVGATPDPRSIFMFPGLGASCTGSENGQDVWWYFRATTTGTATIDLAGSDFDTVLSVYDTSLTEVGCNDDQNGAADRTSRIVDMAVTAGGYYYVRVSGFGTAAGAVHIAMTSAAVTTPPNDPSDPTYYGEGFLIAGARLGYNTGATVQAGEPTAPATCSSSPGSASVWWRYVPTASGFLTVDLSGSTTTAGADFDTVLLVAERLPTGLPGAVLACNDDGGAGLTSRIAELPVVADTRYLIRVASFNTGVTGLVRFNTSFSTVVAGEDGAATAGLALRAPRPNPASSATALTFALDAAGPARLAVYDALGREVAVAFDGVAPAGETEARVDVSGLPAGVYVARLVASGRVESQRLTVVR